MNGGVALRRLQYSILPCQDYAVTNLGAQRGCCGESGEEKWEYPYFYSKLWVMVCFPKCARD